MTPADDGQLARALSLVARESQGHHDRPDIAGWMQRLCRAAAHHLPALGVGVSLISAEGDPITFAASDPRCDRIEELQFTLGEGPCVEAHASRRPVLTADMAEAATSRWPGYANAVQGHGVRAAFAFPLQIGAACLGALVVYREVIGPLSETTLVLALDFAEVATEALLDAQHGAGALGSVQQDTGDTRFERYQAQGMLSVQLGVSLVEAMARMRAYAYAHDRRPAEVADDIVSGKLIFEPDGA